MMRKSKQRQKEKKKKEEGMVWVIRTTTNSVILRWLRLAQIAMLHASLNLGQVMSTFSFNSIDLGDTFKFEYDHFDGEIHRHLNSHTQLAEITVLSTKIHVSNCYHSDIHITTFNTSIFCLISVSFCHATLVLALSFLL